MDVEEYQASKKERAAKVSVASNTLLVVMKIVVGMIIGSVSMISEAIHSGVDLAAAGIALFAVRESSKPPDRDHPFGHGKIENVSGTVEALLIFAAAGWIIYEAADKLRHAAAIESPGWGVLVMLISALVNVAVSRMLFRVGEETESVALKADAWHLRTDVWTSLGVMTSLGVIWGGKHYFPEIRLLWVDPAAAVVVAVVIMKAAFDLTLESSRDLLDMKLPAEEEAVIRRQILALSPAIRSYTALKTRKSGSYRFIVFTIRVDAEMTVRESHRLADTVTEAIRKRLPGTTVTIHIEPCLFECRADCVENCQLPPGNRHPS